MNGGPSHISVSVCPLLYLGFWSISLLGCRFLWRWWWCDAWKTQRVITRRNSNLKFSYLYIEGETYWPPFADDIFRLIFLCENCCIYTKNHWNLIPGVQWKTRHHLVPTRNKPFTLWTRDALVLIEWISTYINYKMWDEIIYPFQNSKGAAVEVWEWMHNFTPHSTGYVITYSY